MALHRTASSVDSITYYNGLYGLLLCNAVPLASGINSVMKYSSARLHVCSVPPDLELQSEILLCHEQGSGCARSSGTVTPW